MVVGSAALIASAVRSDPDGRDEAAAIGERTETDALATALTADRWVVRGVPAITTRTVVQWVQFQPGGTVVGGDDTCGPFVGTWSRRGATLTAADLRRPDGARCAPSAPEIDVRAALAGGASVRLDGEQLLVELEGGGSTWILDRFDRLGAVPTRGEVAGDWVDGEAATLRLDPEGTVAVGEGCANRWSWDLAGETLVVSEGSPGPGCLAVLAGFVPGSSRVRLEGDLLWLATEGDLLSLRRPAIVLPGGFDDLVGPPWVVRGLPGVGSMRGVAWVELRADGTLSGSDGACGIFDGRWEVTEQVLTGRDLARRDPRASCEPPPLDLEADLTAGVVLGRPDGARDQLALDAPGRAELWTLRRVDRIGTAPTAAQLRGTWTTEEGTGRLVLDEDGTLVVQTSSCRHEHRWTLDGGGAVVVEGARDPDCPSWIPGLDLPGTLLVRLEGDRLWLAGDGGIVSLVRAG